MKKIFLILAALLFGMCAFSQEAKRAVPAPFKKGVNLSLWLQAQSAGIIDGGLFTKDDFLNIKAIGADVIRLPVNFIAMSSGAGDYVIDQRLFSFIDKAVSWAEECGLYLIIDNHSIAGAEAAMARDLDKQLKKIWPQIAARYKDKSPLVCYEICNEPHKIDAKKWGKIQGDVLALIRAIDSDRTVIVGGTDWNSPKTLSKLPVYNDKNIIYTFHFYDPMLFTHQGTPWNPDLVKFRDIPFPYSKERMPKKPFGLNDYQNSIYKNYEKEAGVQALTAVLDIAVDFSAERNAPVFCGEFGVYRPGANNADRVAWYKAVAVWLDERNISRANWDYYDSFGLFNSRFGFFPDDLNKGVLEACGFSLPRGGENENGRPDKALSWSERAKQSGDYTIYNGKEIKGVRIGGYFGDLARYASFGQTLRFEKLGAYKGLTLSFVRGAELGEKVKAGYALEFEARTSEKNINIEIYFLNSPDKDGIEWRGAVNLSGEQIKADGAWYKVRVPLKDFADIGAWNFAENKWVESRGLFNWNDIQGLYVGSAAEIKGGIEFRNIRIK